MRILRALTCFALSFTVSSSVPRGEYGEIKIFQSPATYNVESMVLLNEASRKNKEVGYKVTGSLDVQTVWGVDNEFLLKFVLHSPKLLVKGKLVNADYLPIKSFWDSYYNSIFYVQWKNGLVKKAYLNPEDISDVLNYQKSLISLFQLQVIDGEHNETDISGTCDVFYDSISMQVIRKTKRQCRNPGMEAQLFSGVVSTRQLIRYTFNDKLDMLEEIHGEEVYTAGYQNMDAAIKARAWLRLKRKGSPSAGTTVYSTLEAALAELPIQLQPLSLPMHMQDDPLDDGVTLKEALREAVRDGEAEEAGGGGETVEAASALLALRAIRAAPAAALEAALRAAPDARSLAALSRLLGASGAVAAHEAATRELLLAASDAPPPAIYYLHALALAHQPHESVVLDVLRLGEEARSKEVREAALLAAAACASRLGNRASDQFRDELPRHLARCMDDECRTLYVRALGNLRRGDTAELLLEQAQRGGAAALPALQALHSLPPEALGPNRQRRLAALAADARPLEQRAVALDLLLQRAAPLPPPLVLARLARDLRVRGPAELRRLFWQRARHLAHEHTPLANVLAMLAPELRGWDAQAQPGTSSVMVRGVGRLGTGAAQLESLQLTRAGLLRRGSVSLQLHAAPEPLLQIELWTRGLEALAGSGEAQPEAEAEAEDVSGGLALTVGGARLPELSLFDGQAELLGHVWAGRGSSATPALRALLPQDERELLLPMLGGAALRLRLAAALTMALDAQAQVSLWSRTARAELELRLGAAGEVRAELRGAVGQLRAKASYAAEPRLRVQADLDFYERVALCVRTETADHERRSNVTLQSRLGAAGRRVWRQRLLLAPLPGRTLELGPLNSAACRDLLS